MKHKFILYIEYNHKALNVWTSFGSRYWLHGLPEFELNLAGIAETLSAESIAGFRGLPPQLGYEAQYSCMFPIVDGPNMITPSIANQLVEKQGSIIVKDGFIEGMSYVTNPSCKYFSWANRSEFEQALKDAYYKEGQWIYPCEEALVILSILREFEWLHCDARVVFWFEKNS